MGHALPLQEILSKSVHNIFSYPTDRQTDKQTEVKTSPPSSAEITFRKAVDIQSQLQTDAAENNTTLAMLCYVGGKYCCKENAQDSWNLQFNEVQMTINTVIISINTWIV